MSNLIHRLLFSAFFLIMITSCSEKKLDEINFDRNHPHDVSAKFIITDLITSTAFTAVGGDLSLYASSYIEHETGVWNQQYNAEIRLGEPSMSTTYNNSWGGIYANIKAAKLIIAKTSAGGNEAGNDLTSGIARVLLALNLGVLTDFFGDVPFSETGITNPDGTPKFMQPKIDKQSDLYPQIQSILDSAIILLGNTDRGITGSVGAQDIIYGGSGAAWRRAAYGLKARYLMRQLSKSANRNADLAQIIDYTSKSFTSAAQELKFDHYDGNNNYNPLFAFSYSREGLAASKSLAQKFKDLDDPRGASAFISAGYDQLDVDEAIAEAGPNGQPQQAQGIYAMSVANWAMTAPTQMLSYHEVLFLRAEAQARLEQTANAWETLQEAVKSAFANLENTLNSAEDTWMGIGLEVDLSAGVADDYFDNSVSARFDANPIKEIMLQKYLAFYGASGEAPEAYHDYRRMKALGENFITLANPLNAQGKFPLRYPYGSDDVTANLAIKAAYGNGDYVYTENVWWAGGNR